MQASVFVLHAVGTSDTRLHKPTYKARLWVMSRGEDTGAGLFAPNREPRVASQASAIENLLQRKLVGEGGEQTNYFRLSSSELEKIEAVLREKQSLMNDLFKLKGKFFRDANSASWSSTGSPEENEEDLAVKSLSSSKEDMNGILQADQDLRSKRYAMEAMVHDEPESILQFLLTDDDSPSSGDFRRQTFPMCRVKNAQSSGSEDDDNRRIALWRHKASQGGPAIECE